MSDKNIWEGLNFAESETKSVFELLSTQTTFLSAATESLLKMEIERIDAYLDGSDPLILVGVNTMFVVAPNLGNFRRKILIVIEGKTGSRFPVDIHCFIDNIDEKNVDQDQFLDKINEILRRQLVQESIISLYQQSKQIK